MTTPLLTIIVPTYNRVGYLRECLDSLIPTIVDCEILIGDNHSEDETPALVASYTDPRIVYHRHAENIGSTANHNFLLEQARGRYVCLFGDDDLALQECFEKKVALLEARPDISLVYSMIQPINAEGELLIGRPAMGRPTASYIGTRDEFLELLPNCYIAWQTLVFRRSLLAEIGLLREDWGLKASLDWYWIQKMVRHRKTAFIYEPTVCIRMHESSFSGAEVRQKGYWAEDRFAIWRKWLLEDPEPPYVPEAIWERMARCVAIDVKNYFNEDPQILRDRMGLLIEIQDAYAYRVNDLMMATIRSVDPFVPGTKPWPLEDVRTCSYLLPPDPDTASWRAAIESFVRTFTSADDVTLVLCNDPLPGGMDAEAAGACVLELLETLALPDAPDLLLVPALKNEQDLAQLYATVNAVVGANNPQATFRAHRLGRMVVHALTPAGWRRVLTKPIVGRLEAPHGV